MKLAKSHSNQLKIYKMKKIAGILGIVIIALTMFSSINNANSNSLNTSLAGLIKMNVANAEGGSNTAIYWEEQNDCLILQSDGTFIHGTYIDCPAGQQDCTATDCN